MSNPNPNTTKNFDIKTILKDNMVFIMFVVLSLLGIYFANLSFEFIAKELVLRIFRNAFIVLSLIIPIITGMGINFSIVIGAMAAQIAIIFANDWGMKGISGILVTVAIAVVLATIFGFLIGSLLNKMKGQEMIGGLIAGYFANGLYQLVCLFLMGTVIPIKTKSMLISEKMGIKNSLDLRPSIKYAIDDIFKMPLVITIYIGIALIILWTILSYKNEIRRGRNASKTNIIISVVCGVVIAIITMIPSIYRVLYYINIPLVTFAMIAALVLFNRLILSTKLGQKMRTVGQDRVVANAAGINVDKTRRTAIIISTVLAAIGQIIFLQNLGTMQTHTSHEQVGLFAGASLLVGGASIQKASNSQAIIGLILFHIMFIVFPVAGKNLLQNAQLGEYFRVFVSYGVICLSLVMYAWQRKESK